MVASMTAFLIAERLRVAPVYEALLELSQPRELAARQTMWFDIVIEDSSELHGRRVADLQWPEDCHIAVILRGTRELVPRPDTELQPGDLLRVVAETADATLAKRISDEARAGISGAISR
jgi:Trk K+ transport system NAD-binding subunit